MFLAIFPILQCVFLIFHEFQFSRHTSGSTVCISHFPPFWVFLTIFLILQCLCLIFHFSCHILGPTVCVFIFLRIQCFLSYSRSYSVCVTFSTSFSFLEKLQVLQCGFIFFHFSDCFLPYSRTYSGYSTFSMMFCFLAILQVLQCAFLIFHLF